MLSDYADAIRKCGYLSIDVETMTVPIYDGKGRYDPKRLACREYALDPEYMKFISADYGLSVLAEVVSIGVAWGEPEDETSETIYTSFLPHHVEDLEILRTLADEGILFIAHNAIFDLRLLGVHFGIRPKNVWCTLVMSRLLYYRAFSYSLLEVANFCRIPFPKYLWSAKSLRSNIGKIANKHLTWDFYVSQEGKDVWKAEQSAFAKKLDEDSGGGILNYVAWDVILPIHIYKAQLAFIESVREKQPNDASNLRELVEYELRAMRIYCDMSVNGVLLNHAWVSGEISRLQLLVNEHTDWLNARGLQNPNSYQQASKFIYGYLGVPVPDKNDLDNAVFYTATGGLSTSSEALLILYAMYKDDPLKSEGLLHLSIAKLAKQKKNLLENWLGIAALTGRLHSMIVPATNTGRRSSSNPNLQNISMGYDATNPLYSQVRDMVGAFMGDTELWENDIRRAELNLAAALSEDNAMAAACDSADAHIVFAKVYFSDVFEDADKATQKVLRTLGKPITFGIQYGAGAKTVAKNTNLYALQHGIDYRLTHEEAQTILDRIKMGYPHISAAKERASLIAAASGRIVLWTGRKLGIPVNSTDPSNVNYRVAWNYLCQGGIAEIVKRLMVLATEEFVARGLKARVALEIHDSLIVDCPKEILPEVQAILSEKLQEIVPSYLRDRTSPPIRWELDFKGDEDYVKWGFNNGSSVTSTVRRTS